MKKQQEQEKLLAEKQKQQQEKERALAEQQKKQQEQERLFAENQKQQQEQQRQLAEQKQKQQEQEQLLAEKQKQQEELQRKLEEQQQQQQELQQKLEQLQKQQKEQENQLAEKKKQQEEQERLLAEQKKKQDEKERQLAEQKKKLEQERSKPLEAVVVPIKEDKKEQPKPPVPIPENDKILATNSFEYYGTPMGVRWGNIKQFKLKGTTPKDFANGYRELSKSEYSNLVHDCLKLRDDYELCDWAYYKMLQTLSEEACGKGTNQMRFAKEAGTNKLHLLTRINGMPYNCGYTSVDGKIFFVMDGSKLNNLEVCEASVQKEQEMTLAVNKLPKLKNDLSDNRKVISRFVSVEAQTAVNKNMLEFFSDYPTSYDGNDMMSRWAYYANTPVTPEIKEKVYPQLEQYVKGVSKVAGANKLLNWVQMGLKYEYDEKVWGQDRAFFAEESLYYPYCDCEDRSILFSHLMRDLLGLDVVLVYYPGHLATAVCFNEPVEGDYIMVNGRKFTVADPTYYNANVGKTMSRMDNSQAKVILLKR